MHRSEFRVGGVSVEVTGRRCGDVNLFRSLEPFRSETRFSDITIQVEWTASLPPASGQKLFDSGSLWRLYVDGAGFRFDFSTQPLGEQPYKRLLVDGQFRQARLQISESSFAGTPYVVAPLEYPLDELLITHRLTQEQAIELHGSGIVRPDGTGDLFVGHSGAGKSTTTRMWTERENVHVLSDDRIIVRRDEPTVEAPRHANGATNKQQVLRLRDRSASPTGHSAQDDTLKTKTHHSAPGDKKRCGMRMYGTPWHGEAMFASPGSAPLSRIFVLEHGHGNVLTGLSPGQAVGELYARSIVPFHRHEYIDSALQFLQELVEAVPVYRYSFEPDQRAVDVILNFHD